jgi:hypothetical protein
MTMYLNYYISKYVKLNVLAYINSMFAWNLSDPYKLWYYNKEKSYFFYCIYLVGLTNIDKVVFFNQTNCFHYSHLFYF